MNQQQQKLVRARAALDFFNTFGRKPTPEELERQVRRAQAASVHASITVFKRRALKPTGQQLRLV